MTQRDINTNINKLFDEFERAQYDIDKMNIGIELSNDNTKNNINDVNKDSITISEKTNFVDNSLILDMSNSFCGELLNNYTEYYKKKTNKPKNFTLLDGIDKNDVLSTNMPLEELYFEMSIFLEQEKNDPDNCKVILYEEMDNNFVSCDELYCVMIDGNPNCVSKSLFALLIELTYIKMENKNATYDIVNLK